MKVSDGEPAKAASGHVAAAGHVLQLPCLASVWRVSRLCHIWVGLGSEVAGRVSMTGSYNAF